MKQPISKEDLIREYFEREMTMKEIAQAHGIAVGTVYNWFKRYGIKPRPAHQVRPGRKEEVRAKMRGRTSPTKGKHISKERIEILRQCHLGKFKRKTEYGGHKKVRCDGYIAVYCPGAHGATKEGYKMEHILVAEKMLGRYLADNEVVHHINHNRQDNRPENLAVMTASEHMSLHMKERWAIKKGVMTY